MSGFPLASLNCGVLRNDSIFRTDDKQNLGIYIVKGVLHMWVRLKQLQKRSVKRRHIPTRTVFTLDGFCGGAMEANHIWGPFWKHPFFTDVVLDCPFLAGSQEIQGCL